MVEQFKNLETALPSQNSINEEIKNNLIQGMPAIIRYRFFFSICHPKILILRHTEVQFCLLFCMSVKLGLSHWRRNVG